MESEGLRSWVLTMVYRGRYTLEDLRFGAYEDLAGFRVSHKVLPSLSRAGNIKNVSCVSLSSFLVLSPPFLFHAYPLWHLSGRHREWKS